MSEVALYRKYRPGKWSEVVGQEHIVSVLEAAVKNGKTAHAYLFTGSRGTGKTSVARILARALSCSANDLVEIDAASNTGVDDVRALQEGVATLPFESPVKVYIIDEVHMLSKQAFNALLKTIEEPPAHVVFIMATTELHKVPETILSRAEVHHFRAPTVPTLAKVAAKVAKAEGLNLTKDAAELIAVLGDGSFRDTIGLLQKVANLSADKELTREEVEAVTAAPSALLVRELLSAITNQDLNKALKAVKQATGEGKDARTFLKLIIYLIRSAMLAGYAPDLKKEILAEVGSEEAKLIEEIIADKEKLKKFPEVLRQLLAAYLETFQAAVPELPLELALIELLSKEEMK